MDFISASSHLMRTCRNGSIPKKRSIVRLALDTDTHSFITHHSSFIILLKNSAKFCGSIVQRLLKEETDAWDKWCAGRIYTPTLENVLAKVDAFLMQMEQYYQAIERLSLAFWPMMDNGRLLTEKQAKRILAEVRSRLSPLVDDLGLAELIKQVRKAQTHCLTYIREISHKLGQLVATLPTICGRRRGCGMDRGALAHGHTLLPCLRTVPASVRGFH